MSYFCKYCLKLNMGLRFIFISGYQLNYKTTSSLETFCDQTTSLRKTDSSARYTITKPIPIFRKKSKMFVLTCAQTVC